MRKNIRFKKIFNKVCPRLDILGIWGLTPNVQSQNAHYPSLNFFISYFFLSIFLISFLFSFLFFKMMKIHIIIIQQINPLFFCSSSAIFPILGILKISFPYISLYVTNSSSGISLLSPFVLYFKLVILFYNLLIL